MCSDEVLSSEPPARKVVQLLERLESHEGLTSEEFQDTASVIRELSARNTDLLKRLQALENEPERAGGGSRRIRR